MLKPTPVNCVNDVEIFDIDINFDLEDRIGRI